MPAASSQAVFDRARAQIYDLLATAFDGDTTTLCRAIQEGAFRELAGVLPGTLDVGALDRTDLDPESLGVGYDNLFAVPGPHYVPPFATAHRENAAAEVDSDSAYLEHGAAGELYGDSAREMARLYDQVGFRPDVGEGFPDHVAAELAFLAALASSKADLRDANGETRGERAELEALEEAALARMRWVEAFSKATDERDGGDGVFAALASFTASVLEWDRARREDGSEPGSLNPTGRRVQ